MDKLLPASANGTHGLSIWGHDLGAMSLPAILAAVCTLMVVLHILAGGIGYLTSIMTLRVSLQSLLRLRTELYAYLQSLPLKFHDERRSADSSFRVAYDSQSIQAVYSKWFFIFQSTITLAATFATMWAFDWQIALLSLLVVPFMVLAIFLFAKRIPRGIHRDRRAGERRAHGSRRKGLSSVKMVQAFGREEHEVGQFKIRASGSLEANLRLNATSMKSALLVGTLVAIEFSAVMFYVGARHVMEGKLTIGTDLVPQHAAAHALPAARSAHAHRMGAAGRGGGSAAMFRGARPCERSARCARTRRRSRKHARRAGV